MVYCQVIVKPYNIVIEKINIDYDPLQKWKKNRRFVYTCSAYHSATDVHIIMVTNSHTKTAFLDNSSRPYYCQQICQWRISESTFYGTKHAQMRYYGKNIADILFICTEPGRFTALYCPRINQPEPDVKTDYRRHHSSPIWSMRAHDPVWSSHLSTPWTSILTAGTRDKYCPPRSKLCNSVLKSLRNRPLSEGDSVCVACPLSVSLESDLS